MRQGSDGRGTVFPWGYAHGPFWTALEIVYSGNCRGTVVSVDTASATMAVLWDDNGGRYGEITYPLDADYLRKGMPWE